MISKNFAGLIAFLLLCRCAAPVAADDAPTAEKLLLLYEQSVRRLSPVHIEALEKIVERQGDGGRNATGTLKHTIFHDDWRWKIKTDSHTSAPSRFSEKNVESDDRHEYVVDDRLVDVSTTDLVDGKPPKARAAPGRNPAIQAFPGGQSQEDAIWRNLNLARVLFGRLPGDARQPLWKVMRATGTLQVLLQPERTGDATTWIVKSRGKYGEHKVWFDPQAGLPRRIKIRKGPEDLFDSLELRMLDGNFVRSLEVAQKPFRFSTPLDDGNTNILKEWTYRIDDVKIESKGGVPVLVSFERTTKCVYEDGREVPDRHSLQVSDVDFDRANWPGNAFRLWIEIPEGYPVPVTGEDGKYDRSRYEWRQGGIRKVE